MILKIRIPLESFIKYKINLTLSKKRVSKRIFIHGVFERNSRTMKNAILTAWIH